MFDSNWEDADKVRGETKGGSFVRLKDGEKALLVFPVQPYAYRQIWNTRENRSEIYDPAKHDGERPSGRFAFSVLEPVPGTKEYVAKIFDASGETYDKIKTAIEKYGPKYLYEITRKGSGTDTQYNVLPERALHDPEVEYLRTLELLDAEKFTLSAGADDDPATTLAPPPAKDPWSGK